MSTIYGDQTIYGSLTVGKSITGSNEYSLPLTKGISGECLVVVPPSHSGTSGTKLLFWDLTKAPFNYATKSDIISGAKFEFMSLSDAPSAGVGSYSGQENKFVKVNSSANGLEFQSIDNLSLTSLTATSFISAAGFRPSSRVVTTSIVATTTDHTILVNTSGGSLSVSLPSSPADNQIIIIKKVITSSNTLTINRNGYKIDNGTINLVLSGLNQAYALQYVPGFDWAIIG
jgi:hypothetical protein